MNRGVHIRPLDADEVRARGGGTHRGSLVDELGAERAADEAGAQRPQEGEMARQAAEGVARLPESNPIDAEEAEVEDPAVRAAPDPGEPSREERARHELTHLPFRSWCADCVSGRAPDDPHRRLVRAKTGVEVPKVSVDYGFISTPGEDAPRTILVVKVSGCKAVMARCVKGKGRVDPHAVGWLVDQLRRLGQGKCVLQADGEPAQRTFLKDVLGEVASTCPRPSPRRTTISATAASRRQCATSRTRPGS